MAQLTGTHRVSQRVLIVDDEPDLCELLGITLHRMQLPSYSAHTLAGAREALLEGSFALCLTDLQLPDGTGLDLVAWMQEHAPAVPVAVITAHGNVESAVRALKLGAFDFVSKPLDLSDLRRLVAQALKLASRQAATRALLGDSPPLQALRTMVARVARSQAPVHITGESGSGKELVARLIHNSSARRDGPFVAVNCGAIPAELMESELFGHKRGAFTGAIADHKGLIQTAEGGTLFLDEIADLPLHMQVKLLRVIQERRMRPVGEAAEVPVEVRWLSATHENLAQCVADGQFREDLFYRLNVIEVPVPALRDRLEDLPVLTQHILERLAAEQGLSAPTLTPEALTHLAAYAFPGNVRELENLLERAMTLSDGQSLQPTDLQLRPPPRSPPSAGPLSGQLDELEREAIRAALAETRWNQTAAAKRLGMTFRQLRYKIKKLAIDSGT
jgi:two-component system response regulator PilR (NtrC family)